MRILYAVTTCSDNVYKQLFSHVKEKPIQQAQKYHRLLIEGLAKQVTVDVVANPPVNRGNFAKAFLRLPEEEEGGARYHYIPAVRNPILKAVCVGVGTFFRTLTMGNRDSAVIIDCLNRVAGFSAMLGARLSGKQCIGIVTDLPDMLSGSKFSKALANFVIRHCTGYILLTEAMNAYLNQKGKPYVILEGQCDISMLDKVPSPDKKADKRICFYAGGISRRYGLDNLVEGFQMAAPENAQLHLYGSGDYVPELQKIAETDGRIFYGGVLLNTEIVEKEQQATLLVNPRPTNEEYVKYSFPSKTMEYMASGTPVLTTVLPGMPLEYHPYVYLLKEESAEGIAKMLTEVFSHSDEELFRKGSSARQFVLEQKNNVVLTKKILDMLKSM